jgi:hypothetical protein
VEPQARIGSGGCPPATLLLGQAVPTSTEAAKPIIDSQGGTQPSSLATPLSTAVTLTRHSSLSLGVGILREISEGAASPDATTAPDSVSVQAVAASDGLLDADAAHGCVAEFDAHDRVVWTYSQGNDPDL